MLLSGGTEAGRTQPEHPGLPLQSLPHMSKSILVNRFSSGDAGLALCTWRFDGID